jgi:hypothetical protein
LLKAPSANQRNSNLIHECEQKGALVTVLDPHVSTRGEMSHIVLTVLGMVAQMERRFILERQKEGIAQANAQAAYTGGKRRIDRDRATEFSVDGKSPTEIASELQSSRMRGAGHHALVLACTRPARLRTDMLDNDSCALRRAYGFNLRVELANQRLNDRGA